MLSEENLFKYQLL